MSDLQQMATIAETYRALEASLAVDHRTWRAMQDTIRAYRNLPTWTSFDDRTWRTLHEMMKAFRGFQASVATDHVAWRDWNETFRFYRDFQMSTFDDRTWRDLSNAYEAFRGLQTYAVLDQGVWRDLEEAIRVSRQLQLTARAALRAYDSVLAEDAEFDVDELEGPAPSERPSLQASDDPGPAGAPETETRVLGNEALWIAEAVVRREESRPWMIKLVETTQTLSTLMDLACIEGGLDDEVASALEEAIEEFTETVVRTAFWAMGEGLARPDDEPDEDSGERGPD